MFISHLLENLVENMSELVSNWYLGSCFFLHLILVFICDQTPTTLSVFFMVNGSQNFVMNTLKCVVNHVQELLKVLESIFSVVARILVVLCVMSNIP